MVFAYKVILCLKSKSIINGLHNMFMTNSVES